MAGIPSLVGIWLPKDAQRERERERERKERQREEDFGFRCSWNSVFLYYEVRF